MSNCKYCPQNRNQLRIVYILILFLVIIQPARTPITRQASAHNQTYDGQTDFRSLRLSQSFKEKLLPGENHRFHLAIASGQYGRIHLESGGLEMQLSIQKANGPIAEVYFCAASDDIYVSILADTVTDFIVTVFSIGGSRRAGQYELKLTEMRKVSPNDEYRAQADRALAEASRLRALAKMETTYSAVEKYKMALSLYASVADHSTEVVTYHKIGDTYLSINEVPKAFEYYKQGTVLCRKINDRLTEIGIQNSSANAYVRWGENRKAIANAMLALQYYQRNNNPKGEALALHIIGDAYYGLGDLPKSLSYYRRALELFRTLFDWKKQAEVLVSCGYAYVELSDIENAFNAYNEALTLSRDTNDRHTEAFVLRAMGNLQTKLGENQYAINSFESSLGILQIVEDQLLKATVLAGLGYTHERLGDDQKAVDYFDQAAGIFHAIDNKWGEAEVLMDSGDVYYARKNYEKALSNYQQALSLFTKLGMSRYMAQTLRNIGLIRNTLGDQSGAFSCYNRSLSLTRKGQDQRYRAYTLNYMGISYEAMGSPESALDHYHRALKLNRISFDRLGESLTLYNLARVERDIGMLTASRAHIESALELVESLRTEVSSRDLRISYFASAYQCYELYIDILMRIHPAQADGEEQRLAFEAAERARSRALVEMLSETDADINKDIDPMLLERSRILQQLLMDKEERQMEVVARRNFVEGKLLAKEIERIVNEYNDVQQQIKTASPDYAAWIHPATPSLKEIQQVLDDDTFLLEYFLGKDRSYLWVVSRTEIHSYELPDRETIEKLAIQLRELLVSAQPMPGESLVNLQARRIETESAYWQKALELSKILLAPVILPKTKSLIIIADGVLQTIPFGGLPDARTTTGEPTPMILDHEITYEPSASALVMLTRRAQLRQPPPKAVAIFADPVFEKDDPRIQTNGNVPEAPPSDLASRTEAYQELRDIGILDQQNNIPRLMASREEAEAIMISIPTELGFKATGFAANKQVAKDPALANYRIVHFATHGVFNNQKPELSGLLLAQFDQEGRQQDGFLQVKDIYNLSLPVDMVVLSACNTGLGRYVKGEGMLGMTRAFLFAGADRVMASLWRVDDEATAHLMKNFYKKVLEEGKRPAAALRESQIAMWRQNRWHSPYYWAAFELQGEYKKCIDIPLRKNKYSSLWLIAIAGVLLIITAYGIKINKGRYVYGR